VIEGWKAGAGDHDAIRQLSMIADSEPARLTPYQGLLLDLGVLWPPKLFRAAGAEVVRHVVERVDDGQVPDQLNDLLLVLAHSGHVLAANAMRRWTKHPPAGAERLHVEPLDYALEPGALQGRLEAT
jgi:hypothetical protein